jgi:putative hydrolase of the HAD superfamily
MTIRAVLFDLGDTLIFQAHAPDPQVLFSEVAKRVRPLLDSWDAALAIDLGTLLNEIFLAIEAARPARRAQGLEVDGAFITRGALATYGLDVTPEQAAEFWRAADAGLAAWGAQPYPDTLDTLSRLRGIGVPAALVSNSWSASPSVRASLAAFGVTSELLPVIVTSADLMRVKPRPEPFRRALDALGIAARDAVFVGDSLEADIRVAKALGMTTVWKLNGRHEVPPAPEADYAIHDLWELFTLGLLRGASAERESLMPHEDGNAGRY